MLSQNSNAHVLLGEEVGMPYAMFSSRIYQGYYTKREEKSEPLKEE